MSLTTEKLSLALGLILPGVCRNEATMYSYNGVVLPKLPEVEGYDYAFLQVTFSNGKYWWGNCVLSTKPMEYNYIMLPTDYLVATEDCSYIRYTLNDNGDDGPNDIWEWYDSGDVLQGEKICYVTMTLDSEYTCFWANHDIPNMNKGGTFIEASDPIPVYE